MKRIILAISILCAVFGCSEDDEHSDILGYWKCEENSEIIGYRFYDVCILKNPLDTSHYVFSNLDQMGANEDAYVEFFYSNDSITIPEQVVRTHNFSGNGIIKRSSNGIKSISLDYTITKQSVINVKATLN